jgi:hypothetical protein
VNDILKDMNDEFEVTAKIHGCEMKESREATAEDLPILAQIVAGMNKRV